MAECIGSSAAATFYFIIILQQTRRKLIISNLKLIFLFVRAQLVAQHL